jgi:hypothetical protein
MHFMRKSVYKIRCIYTNHYSIEIFLFHKPSNSNQYAPEFFLDHFIREYHRDQSQESKKRRKTGNFSDLKKQGTVVLTREIGDGQGEKKYENREEMWEKGERTCHYIRI